MTNRPYAAVLGLTLGLAGCSATEIEGADPSATAEQPVASIAQELRSAPRLCAGPAGIPCLVGQYCSTQPTGHCPSRDSYGFCADRPKACTQVFDAVCGCDSKTYSSACLAASVGAAVAHRGACESPQPKACTSDVDCTTDSYCQLKAGTCKGTGSCSPRPQICPAVYEPVCGCDGHTYSNGCEASVAGANINYTGPCLLPGPACSTGGTPACPGLGSCVDDPTDPCSTQGGTSCPGVCQCQTIATCVPGTHFDRSGAVCACVPDPPDPCATTDCGPGTRCEVQNGKPVCAPMPGPLCGTTICAPGQICCNPTCGLCVAPGVICSQVVCGTSP
jgi:hypothetical protein